MATSRKIVLMLSSELTAAILGWLAIKLILLHMGKEALGELAFALALVGSFSFIGLLGFRQAHVKRISEGQDLGLCIGTFAYIRIGLLILLAIVVLGGLGVWLYVFQKPLTDVSALLILIILVYYLLFFVNGIPNATFIARQEIAKVAIPTLIGNVFRLVIMCLVAIMGMGVIYLGYAYVIGIIITLILSLILFQSYPRRKPSNETIRSYFRFARPLMFVIIISNAANYIDKVVLGIFSNSKELGVFYAIQRLVMVLFALVTAVEAILFPQLSQMHAKSKNKNQIRERIHVVERWLLLLSVPIVVIFWAIPDPTIMVLLSKGVATTDGYLLLRLLSLMVLIRIILRPYRIVLRAIDRPDLAARVGLVRGLGTIILTCILVPKNLPPYIGEYQLGDMGAVGAAWALLISTALAMIVAQIETYKHLQLHSSYRVFLAGLSGLFTYWLIYTISNTYTIKGWWMLGVIYIIGFTIFWLSMVLMKQSSVDDIKEIWYAIHPKEMSRYMVGELKS